MSLLLLRRLALAGSGLTFLSIALGTLAMPAWIAAQYGYALGGPETMNEYRAVFLGFWLGLAATMLTAARRPTEVLLGDLCGLMIGLQALARLLSFALDGSFSLKFGVVALGELGTAALILLGRPSSRP